MKKATVVLALLLLAGVAGAGDAYNPRWADLAGAGETETIILPQPQYDGETITIHGSSSVTKAIVWYPEGKPYYIHYRYPCPVRWYDAAVKWLKAHLWWPVGEAEAGEDELLDCCDKLPEPQRSACFEKVIHGSGKAKAEAGDYKDLPPDRVLTGATYPPRLTHGPIVSRPFVTYPQLTLVLWSEVNGFLKTEAKAGRAWEYADIIILTTQHRTGTHVFREDEEFYVVLRREVTE